MRTPSKIRKTDDVAAVQLQNTHMKKRLMDMLASLMDTDNSANETIEKLMQSDINAKIEHSMKDTMSPRNAPSEDTPLTDSDNEKNPRKRRLSDLDGGVPEREVRLQKNRVAASKSRQKKKAAFEQLKKDVVELNMEKNNLKNQLFTYINLLENSYNDSSRLRMKIEEMNLENAILKAYVHPQKLAEIRSSLQKQSNGSSGNANTMAPQKEVASKLACDLGGLGSSQTFKMSRPEQRSESRNPGLDLLSQVLGSRAGAGSMNPRDIYGASRNAMESPAASLSFDHKLHNLMPSVRQAQTSMNSASKLSQELQKMQKMLSSSGMAPTSSLSTGASIPVSASVASTLKKDENTSSGLDPALLKTLLQSVNPDLFAQ
eukprot:CAMPEP_0114989848 /NCGR_PEP_ID=MMETSP0216-20121206/10433_1 /TAXON_ID=223996 /ORGANISM="Protocruzia adherens, Strain Boccale" /LENGTH=373 /DNA_ID=CAMNT_0002352887 /DNA_START=372 /DNA_END=1493 /DNA_ORIENTATION=-